jgi:hypothetical protein
MTYVRSFLPWIVYAVVPSAHWQWGALAALAVALVLIAAQVRAGHRADAMIIELGSAAFFAVLTVVAFTADPAGLRPYSAALANATLAVIALVSLAVRRPFTLGIAKRTTPREFWELAPFVHANVVITRVWAASFAVAAVVLALVAGHTAVVVAVQIAGLAVPIAVTNRYVARVRAQSVTAR